jgi:diguanylate cyclase (GGDEF)-like protein
MPDTTPGDELVRLADLEWLDLSDLIRLDEDWRHTLVSISRLHLGVTAIIAVLVIGYALVGRLSPSPVEILSIAVLILCTAGMAYLVLAVPPDADRMLQRLRLVVLLSIAAVSLMVFLLRDLQGDYYLLYLLPLISAAGYLGFTGGLLAGVVSAAAYAVIFLLPSPSLSPEAISSLLLRGLVFVLVASLLGLISERHLSLLGALRASHAQAIQLAVSDTKTGLFNQAFLQARLPSEISRAERSKTPVAFLLIDVDGLDRINREHGYASGDAVLETLGRAIQKQLRVTDLPSRWGVDEFGVLLYNSDAQGAQIVAQRLAEEVSVFAFSDSGGHDFHVTISQGIAAFPTHTKDRSGAELVDRALQAMRRAKPQHGIVVWS